MKKSMFVLVLLILISIANVGAKITITGDVVSERDLDVSSILLKVSVTKGSSVEKLINIGSDFGGEINLEVIGARGVSLEEINLVIGPGESRDIKVIFDSTSLDPGVYVGSIRIASAKEIRSLPVILEVESEDVFFDVNLGISPKYTEISPGEELVANVKVFDLTGFQGSGSLGPTSIDLEYTITGTDGDILSSESESVVIDGQTQFTKTVIFPDFVEEGDYFFSIVVRYKSSVGTSSYLLNVKEPDMAPLLDTFGNNVVVVIFILVFLFILGMVSLFIYLLHDRDRLLLNLRGQNSLELRRQKEFLLAQEKTIVKRKPIFRKKIREEVEKKINELKLKHRQRIKEFKKLREKGNVREMRRKFIGWKKAGYNTFDLEYKLNGLSTKEMKNLMNRWKKKGYTK